ncbi:hypothetical protein D3C79_918470 [compost metagenome]
MDDRVHHPQAHSTDFRPVTVQRLLEGLGGVEHLFGKLKHLAAFGGQADAT